jgi:hypothetical protein
MDIPQHIAFEKTETATPGVENGVEETPGNENMVSATPGINTASPAMVVQQNMKKIHQLQDNEESDDDDDENDDVMMVMTM